MEACQDSADHALSAVAPACRTLDLAAAGALAVAALHGAAGVPADQQLSTVLLRRVSAAAGRHKLAVHDDPTAAQHDSLLLWPLAAAAVHLLRQQLVEPQHQASNAAPSDAIRAQGAAVVGQLLLPLLGADSDGGLALDDAMGAAPAGPAAPGHIHQVLHAVVELLAACRCWDLALTLVQAAVAAERQQPAAGSAPAEAPAPAAVTAVQLLPPDVRMQLAAGIIQQAVAIAATYSRKEGSILQAEEQAGQQAGWVAVLQHAATHTLPAVLSLLEAQPVLKAPGRSKRQAQPASASSGTASRAAVRYLLPAALVAAEQQGRQAEAVEQLQAACRRLLAGAGQARQLGLSLLVQLPPSLLGDVGGPLVQSSIDNSGSTAGQDASLWPSLRACLCDEEATNRKQAAHLLATAVQQQAADGQLAPAWQSYLKLLDCLEELAPHLVKEGWAEIDRLVPPATDTAGGSDGGACLAWEWLEVLWSRALRHEHQQVQRVVLLSFLSRSWQRPAQGAPAADSASPLRYADVRAAFVLHVLLPSAGQAHMWRGEGAAELQQQVAAWVGAYAAALQVQQDRHQLLLALLDLLAGDKSSSADARGQKQLSLQRPFAQTVAAALVAAAESAAAAGAFNPNGERVGGCQLQQEWRISFLCHLQLATANMSSTWGSGGSFAIGMCTSLLQAAAAAVPLTLSAGSSDEGSRALLLAAGAWLQQLPITLLLPGSQLHEHAVAWLQSAGQRQLLVLLADCLREYMARGFDGSPAQPALQSVPAGWAGWQLQAGILARLVLLLSASPTSSSSSSSADCVGAGDAGRAADLAGADLAVALSSWTEALGVLHRRPYLALGTAQRCLLLLSQLLAVASPSLPPAGAQPQQAQQADSDRPGREQKPLAEWLAGAVASAADELVSYAAVQAAAHMWGPPPVAAVQPAGSTGTEEDASLASQTAQLSLQCVAGSLRLLLTWRSTSAGERQQALAEAVAQAADRLAHCCADVLQSFVAARTDKQVLVQQQGQAGRAASLPATAAEWDHAAAQLTVLADGCLALAAAAETRGPQHTTSSLQRHSGMELAAMTAAALDTALALQAAAASVPKSGGDVAAAAAYCHRLCWRAAESLLELQSALGSHAQQAQQAVGWEQQQARVLVAALGSLEASAGVSGPAADPRRTLLQLRCCRRLLLLAVERPRLLQLVLSHGQHQHQHQQGEEASASLDTLVSWLCGAAWRAFEGAAAGSNRRRVGLTAALVSTCLHPALFQAAAADATRQALHLPSGPLQQLLRRLLAAGAKSWRTTSIVSLQLCGLLSWHAELAEQYSDAVQQLLLWGTAEDPGKSGVGDQLDSETAAELAALVAPGDAELAAAYGASELAPRVAALCMLRSWVQQAQAGASQPRVQPYQAEAKSAEQQREEGASAGLVKAGETAGGRAGLLMWRQLLDRVATDPELSAARYNPLGPTHRKKVRVWQALCVLCPLVPPQQAEQDLECILSAMSLPDVANVKQYQDAIALQLLTRQPRLLRARILPLLRDCGSSASYALSSLILLAARAATLQLRGSSPTPAAAAAVGEVNEGDSEEEELRHGDNQQQCCRDGHDSQRKDGALLCAVVAAITPWALSHVHALRTFAQLVLWRLYELFPGIPAADPTAAALLRFFRENEDVKRLRRGLTHVGNLDQFDLEAAVTPAGILCSGTSVHRIEAAFEGAPQSLLEEVQQFLTAERQHLRQDLHQSKVAAATAELAPPHQQQQARPSAPPVSSNWQKKGGGLAPVALPSAAAAGRSTAGAAVGSGAWAAALGTAALLAPVTTTGSSSRGLEFDPAELELAAAEEAAAVQARGARQQLLVVASLLSRAANLAGLARTCEVFRASGLVVPDLSVTKQQEFKSIAVTAHHWLPMIEVPEATLAVWLQRQAAQGWTLVGLEQSAQSVPLQEFRFPPRTVLVLGREREGIPADLLGLMHHTVEIPQLGIIRSLNVHVSGALAVFEYTRQALAAGCGGQSPS